MRCLRVIVVVAAIGFALACASDRRAAVVAPHDSLEIERRLLKLTDQWTQVDVTSDRAVLEKILAPDFVSTSRSGKFRNRQQLFDAWRNEGVTTATNSDVIVHVYAANVAVVTGVDTTVGTKDGVEWTHQDRFTTTWVKRNETWQCVAAHVTRIR